MPIFRDDIDNTTDDATDDCRRGAAAAPLKLPPPPSPSHPRPCLRRLSEESIRTELCEVSIPDEPLHPATPSNQQDVMTSDRTELMEMIKRGASPTWIPNKHLGSMMQHIQRPSANDASNPPAPESQTLLPSLSIAPEKGQGQDPSVETLRDGMSIERPRSALHSGDFAPDKTDPQNRQDEPSSQAGEEQHAAPHDWFPTSPPRHFLPFDLDGQSFASDCPMTFTISRPSSLSSSLSSFVYQPPTSPLVHAETNDELSAMSTDDLDLDVNRQASARRHTLYSSYATPFISSHSPCPSLPPPRAGRRREGALPYQAHQPRRSLSGAPGSVPHHGPSPSTPALMRARRLSTSSDLSPLHHASMVGSYEESILRGRMSTTPSKPIEFLAQIGVLGKGSCNPTLKCPRHVTLPFPAVFYNYDHASHGSPHTGDGISPYVGQIDLENGLPDEASRSRRKAQSRINKRSLRGIEPSSEAVDGEVDAANLKLLESAPSKAPPGGSYRIPERGQLQIVVKNQNKTAVKLFLVPYDLRGMTPGTKTFIRQRSYSASFADGNPACKQQPGLQPETSILRYLIHLHICSPHPGRFYLYKSIRIVFANRVPDGKEKLRNETTWPEPRFSPYKPIRLMSQPVSSPSNHGPASMLAAEKAMRRRSLGPTCSSYLTDRVARGLPPPPEVPWTPQDSRSYEKMNGFGASSGSGSGSEGSGGASLLSRRLRELSMKSPPASSPPPSAE